MVLKPREMACLMMSSSWSFAWPGQNWPEWECIVNAMVAVGFIVARRNGRGKQSVYEPRRRLRDLGANNEGVEVEIMEVEVEVAGNNISGGVSRCPRGTRRRRRLI
jgi:hypothetical protein